MFDNWLRSQKGWYDGRRTSIEGADEMFNIEKCIEMYRDVCDGELK